MAYRIGKSLKISESWVLICTYEGEWYEMNQVVSVSFHQVSGDSRRPLHHGFSRCLIPLLSSFRSCLVRRRSRLAATVGLDLQCVSRIGSPWLLQRKTSEDGSKLPSDKGLLSSTLGTGCVIFPNLTTQQANEHSAAYSKAFNGSITSTRRKHVRGWGRGQAPARRIQR
jgi:hypothetical protein